MYGTKVNASPKKRRPAELVGAGYKYSVVDGCQPVSKTDPNFGNQNQKDNAKPLTEEELCEQRRGHSWNPNKGCRSRVQTRCDRKGGVWDRKRRKCISPEEHACLINKNQWISNHKGWNSSQPGGYCDDGSGHSETSKIPDGSEEWTRFYVMQGDTKVEWVVHKARQSGNRQSTPAKSKCDLFYGISGDQRSNRDHKFYKTTRKMMRTLALKYHRDKCPECSKQEKRNCDKIMNFVTTCSEQYYQRKK